MAGREPVTRWTTAAGLLVLGVLVAPPEARTPPPPAGWDLFAADALLGAFSGRGGPGALAEEPPRTPALRPASAPEPAGLLLTALGVAGLGLHRAATGRGRARP